jgi:hypothetical protein
VLLVPGNFALVASYLIDFSFIELVSDVLASVLSTDEVRARQSADSSSLVAYGVQLV